MKNKSTDLALEVLLEVRPTVSADLTEGLLRESYEIQKRFQFDRDRELPLKAMQRLIERFVDESASETSKGPGSRT